GESAPVAALKACEVPGTNLVVIVHVAVGEPIDEHLVDDLGAPVADVRGEARLRTFLQYVDAAYPGRDRGREDESETEDPRRHDRPHGYEDELNHHSAPTPAKCSTLRCAATSSTG